MVLTYFQLKEQIRYHVNMFDITDNLLHLRVAKSLIRKLERYPEREKFEITTPLKERLVIHRA